MAKEFITVGYEYKELSEQAKQKVREWYIDDPIRSDTFYEFVLERLEIDFPNSDLKVQYSLGYCQGDGLNITGKLDLYDFLKLWNASEKEKRTIEFYLKTDCAPFNFTENIHDGYSCKFLDKKYIGDDINEWVNILQFQEIRGIKEDVISKFYNDMVDYFEQLDKQYEKDGYKYLYEPDEEELEDFCEANEYYFTEKGEFIA